MRDSRALHRPHTGHPRSALLRFAGTSPIVGLYTWFALAFVPLGSAHAAPGDEYWWCGFGRPGVSASSWTPYVAASAVFEGQLVIAGRFESANGVEATSIATWDGERLRPLGVGLGIGSQYVSALTVLGGELVAGGNFTALGDGTPTPYLARWDGSNWTPFSSGPDAPVRCLETNGTDLYVGGDFTNAGGVAAQRVAHWDGTTWHALGAGISNSVSDLEFFEGDLHATGGFLANVNRGSGFFVQRWDGLSWSPVGSNGFNLPVLGLATFDTQLVACGEFTLAGADTIRRVAVWDGASWSSIGSGLGTNDLFSEEVETLFPFEGNLYATGYWFESGETKYVSAWNGLSWSVQGEMSGNVNHLNSFLGELYAGGAFELADGLWVNRITRYDGTKWQPLGLGVNQGQALAYHQGNLYLGGSFEEADGVAGNRVLEFQGNQWAALGGGVGAPGSGDQVLAMLSYGDDLVVAGFLSEAEGSPVANIVRWTGAAWLPLADGVNDVIQDLAVFDGSLVAGGLFTTAGSAAANYIASWDGSAWSAFPVDFDQQVDALAVLDGRLHAAGDFDFAGTNPVGHVVSWNGSDWNSLSQGPDGTVADLAVYNGVLIAAGAFTEVDGSPASNIAGWNGFQWFPLGAGLSGPVFSLAVHGDGLYASGLFFTAGGLPASGVAKWDGVAWSPLGSGLGSLWAQAMQSTGEHLYLTGVFAEAGGVPSMGMARWDEPVAVGVPDGSPDEWSPLTTVGPRFVRLSPNPTASHTTIVIDPNEPRDTWTELAVFDLLGRRHTTLFDGLIPSNSGPHTIAWNLERNGTKLPAGTYWLRLRTRHGTATTRITVLR